MRLDRLRSVCLLALLASLAFAATQSSSAFGERDGGSFGQGARNVIVFVAAGVRCGTVAAIGPDFKVGYQDVSPAGGPEIENSSGPQILRSEPAANGVSTTLSYQQEGASRYFDAADFADRPSCLPGTDGPPLVTLLAIGLALVVCGVLGLVSLLPSGEEERFSGTPEDRQHPLLWRLFRKERYSMNHKEAGLARDDT
jgi:hypothetical protein